MKDVLAKFESADRLVSSFQRVPYAWVRRGYADRALYPNEDFLGKWAPDGNFDSIETPSYSRPIYTKRTYKFIKLQTDLVFGEFAYFREECSR